MNFTNFMLLSTMALVAATSASAEGSDALPQLRGADAVQKSCIDNKKPKKDGYEFEYFGKGKCVDKHDKTYEYGQFDDVKVWRCFACILNQYFNYHVLHSHQNSFCETTYRTSPSVLRSVWVEI